ncbi:hypothetical protein GCM10027567_16460 [Spongiibacter taiwanensis]
MSKKEESVGAYEDEVDVSTIKRAKSISPTLTAMYTSSLLGDQEDLSKFIIGDKYPKYYTWDLDFVSSVLGVPKFIHVTRNPYDVINSCIHRRDMAISGNDWWPIRSSSEYLNDWIDAWNFSSEKNLSDDFLHIKYEDFIENPSAVSQKLASFLDIENRFDISIVNVRRPEVARESQYKKLIEAHLAEEILCWDMDVYELQKKFPVIKRAHVGLDAERLSCLYQRKKKQWRSR